MLRAEGQSALLEHFRALVAAGVATVRDKLNGTAEAAYVRRLVELWSFFYATVLPYVQGIFEPLKPELAVLRTLPWLDASTSPGSFVRDTVLLHFRNDVVLPNVGRLQGACAPTASICGVTTGVADAAPACSLCAQADPASTPCPPGWVRNLSGPLQALLNDGAVDLHAVDLALKVTQMVSVLRGPYASPDDLAQLDQLALAAQRPFQSLHLSLASLRA